MNRRFKRFTSFILLFLIFFQFMPTPSYGAGVSVTARGAIAVDYDTGEVLYEKNPDKMLVPASMTKLMTVYIMYQEMEAGRLDKDSLITVSPHAARISRDSSYPMAVPLKSGGKYTVDQFIKLILLPSASASCIAVAEHISGSEAKFVEKMNLVAKEIGMKANFKNSHGAKVHYTTPRGMATLVERCIRDYPDILNYTSMTGFTFEGKWYPQLNRLVTTDKYKGADGMKTGTIKEAGYCLAATSKQNGMRIIVTVFGGNSQNARYSDAKKIFDYSFAKLNKNDNSRNNTKIDIVNIPEELRLNSEYKLDIKYSNVKSSYLENAKVYLDGDLVKTIKNSRIKNNMTIGLPISKEDTNKDKLELKYIRELANGKTQEISKTIAVSNKEARLFKDVKDDELEEKIRSLVDKKIMNGLPNGYFGIDKTTNRGDFITSLGRFVEANNLDIIEDKPSNYKDVKDNDYFNKYTSWATEHNLIQGYKGNFMPKREITIEETYSILDAFLKEYRIEFKTSAGSNIEINKASDWAKESIRNLEDYNLLGNTNPINPKSSLTRINLTNILSNSLDYKIEDEIDFENSEKGK